MRRGAIAVFVVLALAQVAFANPLIEEWSSVQQALAASDLDSLEVSLQRLLNESNGLGLKRATPFASALAAGSFNRPDEISDVMLMASKRLDPLLPAPRFIAGERAWNSGRKTEAVGEFVTGVANVLRHEPTRASVLISMVPWLVPAVGIMIACVLLVQILRYIRIVVFDAYILGLSFFGTVNAVVFACVALILPIFIGLGPVWLVIYLFALTWIYSTSVQRIGGVLCLLLLICLVPVLELWKGAWLAPVPLEHRVGRMLEHRQIDYSTLREFTELEPTLDGVGAYHLVAGEVLRMHGDREYARQQYEKALMAAPSASLPAIFLGVLALEDKDPFRAIELLNSAVERGPDAALAHYNLAVALDLTRRFNEGDASRRTAMALGGREIEQIGLRGYDERALYPRLGADAIRAVTDAAPENARILLRGGGLNVPLKDGLLAPLTLAGVFGLVCGVCVYFLRKRFFGPGRECIKCGRVFRQEDNSVYCNQCVSVFLKRNAVSIEQQTAKAAQVRRWVASTNWIRRLAGILIPGGGAIAGGNIFRGMALSLGIWVLLAAAAIWLPLFLQEVVPTAPILAVQIVLLFIGISMWVVTAVSAWSRR